MNAGRREVNVNVRGTYGHTSSVKLVSTGGFLTTILVDMAEVIHD